MINLRFEYEGARLSDLIKEYEIVDNNLSVTYFDDTTTVLPLSEENNVLELMLEQAIERSESSELDKTIKMKNRALLAFLSLFFCSFISTANICISESNFMKILSSISGGITTAFASVFAIVYKNEIDKINELKKYDIYLNIKNELDENITNSNLFAGIKIKNDNLNINTLDEFSLKDLKKISNNLRILSNETNYNVNITLSKKINN